MITEEYVEKKDNKKRNRTKKGIVIIIFIVLLAIFIPLHVNNGYKEKYIECENWGCRIVLPDGWKGKCDIEIEDDYISAYYRKSRIFGEGGRLFIIKRWDGVYSEKQVEEDLAVAPNIYLGTNNGYTYVITCASSVETNTFYEEYDKLYQQIGEIYIEFY